MKRLFGALVALAVLALTIVVTGATAGGGTVTDGTSTGPAFDATSAIVQLKGDPLSTYVRTRPAPGKKVDFSSSTTRSYRAQLLALRNSFKQWLRANAPAAKVTGESDLSLINAIQAWNTVGGPANAGAGVKVGVIDTGIDISHPCFSDAGYPVQTQLGDHNFTNNKVIVARVFNNQSPRFGYTPAPIQEHGTHVAGTVACNLDTPATVDGVTIPYGVSGVAPRALLGNYTVFPGEAGDARSEDILNALEAAYADGMDIVNLSLGGSSHGVQDLLTDAIDDLDQANMISAVAAGNSGPGHFTIESPGAAARALTAGASTVPHFIGAPVTVNGSTYGVASGDFETVSADLTAPLSVVLDGTALGLACSALPAGSLTGKIALISRGTCTFSTKIRNAQTAGALAVLVVNNVAGDPIAMGQDGTANQPTIPAYMAALSDKTALMAADTDSTTIGAALAYFSTVNANIMAGFSSQGPTDVDFRVKPDVVAPGVNVLSSIPAAFCAAPASPSCWAFFQS